MDSIENSIRILQRFCRDSMGNYIGIPQGVYMEIHGNFIGILQGCGSRGRDSCDSCGSCGCGCDCCGCGCGCGGSVSARAPSGQPRKSPSRLRQTVCFVCGCVWDGFCFQWPVTPPRPYDNFATKGSSRVRETTTFEKFGISSWADAAHVKPCWAKPSTHSNQAPKKQLLPVQAKCSLISRVWKLDWRAFKKSVVPCRPNAIFLSRAWFRLRKTPTFTNVAPAGAAMWPVAAAGFYLWMWLSPGLCLRPPCEKCRPMHAKCTLLGLCAVPSTRNA